MIAEIRVFVQDSKLEDRKPGPGFHNKESDETDTTGYYDAMMDTSGLYMLYKIHEDEENPYAMACFSRPAGDLRVGIDEGSYKTLGNILKNRVKYGERISQ